MAELDKIRCSWAMNDALMRDYHDREWGVPQRDGRMLWEMLMLEGFQAGLAWITVLRKRDAFRAAFSNFDPAKMARFGEPEIARLLQNEGIIRSRAKIEATIRGAQIFLEFDEGTNAFSQWVWSFVNGKPLQNTGPLAASTPLSEKISKELKSRGFKFVGSTIVYAWMQACGLVNDHADDCFRRKDCAAARPGSR